MPHSVTSGWPPRYALTRAERRFVRGDPPPEWTLREIRSPLTEEKLARLPSRSGVVQFKTLLTDDDFRRLAEWFREHPHATLRAYGSYDRSITDLEFLRFFPFLRRFSADTLYLSLQSLDGLRHLPEDLERLSIGGTKRKLDLAILSRFGGLKSLYLEGPTKGISVVSRLTSLEDLTLRSITLPDLSILLPLTDLLALHIKLGGIKDLSLLPQVGRLRYLELWMVKGLNDLSPVGGLPHLRYLFLQAQRQVTALPDLSENESLRRIHLETMKGLRDLRPLATAPALEELLLVDMGHLQLEDLRCLVGLPNLKAVTPGLSSLRKAEAARAMLGLPHVEGRKIDWRKV